MAIMYLFLYLLVSIIGISVIGGVLYAVGRFVKNNCKLITVCTLAVFVVIAGFILLPPARAASETVTIEIDDYITEAVVVDGEPVLLITFGYQGDKLSFYWEGQLDTSRALSVTIWLPGQECIDSEQVNNLLFFSFTNRTVQQNIQPSIRKENPP